MERCIRNYYTFQRRGWAIFWNAKPKRISDYEQLAYGRLGWDEDKFWSASISYFFKSLIGFNDLEFERTKTQWTISRWQSALLLKPHAKNGLSPRDITVFPWEEDEKPLTKKEWIEQNKEIFEVCKKLR